MCSARDYGRLNIFIRTDRDSYGSWPMRLRCSKNDLKKQAINSQFGSMGRVIYGWERFRLLDGQSLMDAHPDVQFYDYTKVYNRLTHDINNYYLVFSYSGTNRQECIAAMTRGYNVAVVFGQNLPSRFWRRKVFIWR